LNSGTRPLQVIFDPTAEIFATDNTGSFNFVLKQKGNQHIETDPFDEVRLVFSIWHPSGGRSIDLDRAYAEVQGSFGADADHWVKLAEIEPVVSPYSGGDRFDGWIVLPAFSPVSAFALVGAGFEPRARLQIRAFAYFVA